MRPNTIPIALRTEFGNEDEVTLVYADPPEIICDCGNGDFRFNRCTQCGSVAPWAAKLGCGLA